MSAHRHGPRESDFFGKIQTFLLSDALDLRGRRAKTLDEYEYSASLALHARLCEDLLSYKLDESRKCYEMLQSVFFDTEITCVEVSLIRRVYKNSGLGDGNPVYLFHLLHLLVEPVDQDAVDTEWTLAAFRRQQHCGLLLQFLKFFKTNHDFLCLVIGQRTDFWPHRQQLEIGEPFGAPELFNKVLWCEGSVEVFDFLVEHDASVGTRWAYSIHCEFFDYLHHDYACIQENGGEDGLKRLQSRLRERMCKLDSILQHNGKHILTHEYTWVSDGYSLPWIAGTAGSSRSSGTAVEIQKATMIGFYIKNSMRVLTQHCSTDMLQAIEQGSEGTENYYECNSYLTTMRKLIISCPESLLIKFGGEMTTQDDGTMIQTREPADAFQALDHLPKLRFDHTGMTDVRNTNAGNSDPEDPTENGANYYFSTLHYLTCRDIYAMVLPRASLRRLFHDIHVDNSVEQPQTWEVVSHAWKNQFMLSHMHRVLDNLHDDREFAIRSLVSAPVMLGRLLPADVIDEICKMSSAAYREEMDNYPHLAQDIDIMADFHHAP
jgi:hypothetical protein